MTAGWPAGTARAADVVAGGWPQTLVAFTALASAAFSVLASAAVPPPRRPLMMLEETMAAPRHDAERRRSGSGRSHGRAFIAMVIFVETSRVLRLVRSPVRGNHSLLSAFNTCALADHP